MSTDIHITLGRLNMAAIESRAKPKSECKELALFPHLGQVEHGDFEFQEVPFDLSQGRHFMLFSWLSDADCAGLRQLPGVDERQEQTRAFLNWLEHARIGDHKYAFDGSHIDAATVSERGYHWIGDWGLTIYTVNTLQNFDYGQIAEFEMKGSPYEKENRTYREWLGPNWFKLLDYCLLNNWHFIIFGYDN